MSIQHHNPKVRLRKGDSVIILKGKDKGKKGNILRIYPEKEKVIVERVNFAKRHTRPTQKNPQGGILEREAPIHVSNLALFCAKCNAARRFRNLVLKDGKKTRICVKCGETLGKEQA